MRLVLLRDHQHLLNTCLEMYADFYLERDAQQGKPQKRKDIREDCLELLQERLVDSNRQIFLFERGRSYVGFAEVAIEERCFPDEDLPESCVRIVAFYIVPQERRKKLGSAFFKIIRDWGRDQKAALIEVDVLQHGPSIQQFLTHQGLELVGAGVQNCYRSFL